MTPHRATVHHTGVVSPARLAVAAAAPLLLAAPAAAAPTPLPQPTAPVPTPSVTQPPVTPDEPDKPARPRERIERVRVSIAPSQGSFGVGQLITARFSAPVRFRAKAEAAMQVTSAAPLPPGAWGWIDSRTAVYRPKRFWPGRTRIDVNLTLRKVPLNADPTTKWVGGRSTQRTVRLRTARSFIARIDSDTHQMRVFRDDRLVKVFGVSLGKPGFSTRSGVKIITGEKYPVLRMTSADLGLTDEYYDLQVPYAVRITPSGEFIHAAPWALSRIGLWNGSHGCTNLAMGPAKWFYNHVRAGDVTVTTNTGRRMETWNGIPGSYWNYSWKQWLAKSALQ